MTRAAMIAPFAEEELRQFKGRGGKTMTFIEDETVMDRLDIGYGPGNWQVHVEAVSDKVVKVRLGVREHGEWTWNEDFGYPNQDGGESLKEAVSDGIRRCGRYYGIARDLYRKATYEPGGALGPRGTDVVVPDRDGQVEQRPELDRPVNDLIGTVEVGKPPVDMELRQDKDLGPVYGFKLKNGTKAFQVLAVGDLAAALSTVGLEVGMRVTVEGSMVMVPWQKAGQEMPPFSRVMLTRVHTSDYTLPADVPESRTISADEAEEILRLELQEASDAA